jgi:hypothetical protein
VALNATTSTLLLDAALATRNMPAALSLLQEAVRTGEVPPRDTLWRLLMQTKRVGDNAALTVACAACDFRHNMRHVASLAPRAHVPPRQPVVVRPCVFSRRQRAGDVAAGALRLMQSRRTCSGEGAMRYARRAGAISSGEPRHGHLVRA